MLEYKIDHVDACRNNESPAQLGDIRRLYKSNLCHSKIIATAIRDEWADEKIHQELVDKCEFSISNGTKSFNKASFGIIMLLTLVLLKM